MCISRMIYGCLPIVFFLELIYSKGIMHGLGFEPKTETFTYVVITGTSRGRIIELQHIPILANMCALYS